MVGSFLHGRRRFLGHAIAAGITTQVFRPAQAAEPQKKLPIRIINTQGIASSVLQILMQKEQYLAKFGLEPQFLSVADGNKIISALVGDDADICMFSGFSQVLPAIEKGGGLKIVAGSLITPVHLVYAKQPEIRTVKDLEGKTVGVGPLGALLHQMMTALLKAKNVDVSKVQFVNVGSAGDVFRAIVAGKVDAGPADFDYFDPKYGVHVLEDGQISKELPNFTFQASYTSQRIISERREALVRTLAAYASLYRFLKTSAAKDAYRDAFFEAQGKKDEEEAQKQWDFIQSHEAYSTGLVLSEERVRYAQQLNLDAGAQKRMLSYDETTDMSIAKDAIALLESSNNSQH